jgi:hypothetical protein
MAQFYYFVNCHEAGFRPAPKGGCVHHDLLLVGSIPLDTVEDVFSTFGKPLGGHLASVPDGEVGLRKHWISRVHFQVLAIHPDIEVVRQPRPDDGVERLNPHDASDSWKFRVRDGVGALRFGDEGWRLGFARDAVNSHFVFKTLKAAGILAPHLRFQVSIPTINSMLPPRIFASTADMEKVKPGLATALNAEIATIVAKIPHEDLAIQFDCATEIQDAYGGIAELPRESAIARNAAQIAAMVPYIPERVAVGYHFCFGTLGGWPRFSPDDLGAAVELANAFVVASGRRVDWVHLPVLDTSDDAFFAPLKNLKSNGARVYLGAIHHMDNFDARLAAARKYCPDFGLAAYCGFGRMSQSEMPNVLADHLLATKASR